MSKQEEIREEMKKIIIDFFPSEHPNCDDSCTTKYLEKENIEQLAQRIIGYLHSQDVVIKVDSHHCINSRGLLVNRPYPEIFCSCCNATSGESNFVAVEPLIEE